MKLKTLRLLGLLAMLYCAFQLGRIDARTEHFKKIVECVGLQDIDMAEYYGHNATVGYIFNHADAMNSHIYLRCIYKDLYE